MNYPAAPTAPPTGSAQEVSDDRATTPARRAKAIAAITLGNGLEFFDFTVYSFFATIIGKLYFPVEGQLAQLMLAVGSFGVGFIMRPVGGIVLRSEERRVGKEC